MVAVRANEFAKFLTKRTYDELTSMESNTFHQTHLTKSKTEPTLHLQKANSFCIVIGSIFII